MLGFPPQPPPLLLEMSDLEIYVIALGIIFFALNIYRLYKESKGEGED